MDEKKTCETATQSDAHLHVSWLCIQTECGYNAHILIRLKKAAKEKKKTKKKRTAMCNAQIFDIIYIILYRKPFINSKPKRGVFFFTFFPHITNFPALDFDASLNSYWCWWLFNNKFCFVYSFLTIIFTFLFIVITFFFEKKSARYT